MAEELSRSLNLEPVNQTGYQLKFYQWLFITISNAIGPEWVDNLIEHVCEQLEISVEQLDATRIVDFAAGLADLDHDANIPHSKINELLWQLTWKAATSPLIGTVGVQLNQLAAQDSPPI